MGAKLLGVVALVLVLLGGAVAWEVTHGGLDRTESADRADGRDRGAGNDRPRPTGPTVASLNVLGASHTGPEGDSKPDWPAYQERLTGVMDSLREHRVSVAGLQELQKPQWRLFGERYGEAWDIFPTTDTVITGNSIVWRRSDWTRVAGRQFDIPYFGGDPQAQSWVELEATAGGETIYVVDVHNPFDLGGTDNERLRDRALRIERRLVERFAATGSPVYLMGDFNEITDPHCAFTRIGMDNAFGPGTTSPCAPPERAGIDQVFSINTPARRARTDESVIEDRYADHPLVVVPLPGPSPAGSR